MFKIYPYVSVSEYVCLSTVQIIQIGCSKSEVLFGTYYSEHSGIKALFWRSEHTGGLCLTTTHSATIQTCDGVEQVIPMTGLWSSQYPLWSCNCNLGTEHQICDYGIIMSHGPHLQLLCWFLKSKLKWRSCQENAIGAHETFLLNDRNWECRIAVAKWHGHVLSCFISSLKR